jgi:hypothetical protein
MSSANLNVGKFDLSKSFTSPEKRSNVKNKSIKKKWNYKIKIINSLLLLINCFKTLGNYGIRELIGWI